MNNSIKYINSYLQEVKDIADSIDQEALDRMISHLGQLQAQGGRLFILGVGGSAANASHAVNDFRKILGIETYAPTDNVSELTARVNDDGWDTTFWRWLETSQLSKNDALLVFSVGGGSAGLSENIVNALAYGKECGCKIFSVVSRTGGASKEASHECILIPPLHDSRITPHAEEWQGIIWHLIVSCLSKSL